MASSGGGLPATDTSQTCHVPSGLQGVSLDGAQGLPPRQEREAVSTFHRDMRMRFNPHRACDPVQHQAPQMPIPPRGGFNPHRAVRPGITWRLPGTF